MLLLYSCALLLLNLLYFSVPLLPCFVASLLQCPLTYLLSVPLFNFSSAIFLVFYFSPLLFSSFIIGSSAQLLPCSYVPILLYSLELLPICFLSPRLDCFLIICYIASLLICLVASHLLSSSAPLLLCSAAQPPPCQGFCHLAGGWRRLEGGAGRRTHTNPSSCHLAERTLPGRRLRGHLQGWETAFHTVNTK